MQRPEKVQKAEGKLAVLLPGIGAVSTTLMAGVMLANKGLGLRSVCRALNRLAGMLHVRPNAGVERRRSRPPRTNC